VDEDEESHEFIKTRIDMLWRNDSAVRCLLYRSGYRHRTVDLSQSGERQRYNRYIKGRNRKRIWIGIDRAGVYKA